jgi:hypothetical protein
MGTELLVYGAGGFAREVAWLAEEAGYKVLAFVDDDPPGGGGSLMESLLFPLKRRRPSTLVPFSRWL